MSFSSIGINAYLLILILIEEETRGLFFFLKHNKHSHFLTNRAYSLAENFSKHLKWQQNNEDCSSGHNSSVDYLDN